MVSNEGFLLAPQMLISHGIKSLQGKNWVRVLAIVGHKMIYDTVCLLYHYHFLLPFHDEFIHSGRAGHDRRAAFFINGIECQSRQIVSNRNYLVKISLFDTSREIGNKLVTFSRCG